MSLTMMITVYIVTTVNIIIRYKNCRL